MKTTVLLLAGFMLSGWAPVLAQRGNSNPNFAGNTNITVQVRFKSGTSGPSGAMVTLEGEGSGPVASAQTDSQGKVSFHPPDAGYYVVSVRYPGYEEASERVDLTTNPQAFVTIVLKPTPGGNQPSGTTFPANIPENAVKEYQTGEKLLNEKKDAENAIKHFQKAIQLYPGFSKAYMMLGLIYLDQKNFDAAAPALQKATELDPKLPGAYFGLGALFSQQKKFPEAAKALESGLELAPRVSDAQYQLAQTYFAMERWDDAETHAHTVVSLAPQFAPVHILLGDLALRKNDATTAKAEFSEYLRLDPKGPMAAGATQMIEKIDEIMQK